MRHPALVIQRGVREEMMISENSFIKCEDGIILLA